MARKLFKIFASGTKTVKHDDPHRVLKALPTYSAPRGISSQAYEIDRTLSEMAWAISLVAFHGKIPDGSAGKDHAEYAKLACLQAMARADAKCLIMDVTDLEYRWGNSILEVFDTLRRLYFYEWHDIGMSTPVKVVVSERSVGFCSLLPPEMIFDEVSAAVASLNKDLEKWCSD